MIFRELQKHIKMYSARVYVAISSAIAYFKMKKQGGASYEGFEEYFALYAKGAYRDAYAVLREIMQNPPYSTWGDLYVWCANLELVVNDDVGKTLELLEKANELGCRNMASYYLKHGFAQWRTGERARGIEELEKSVALSPSIHGLATLGKVLSTEGDKRAMTIWYRVLKEDPKHCHAHLYIGRGEAQSGNRGKAVLMAKRAERLATTAQDFSEVARLYFELDEFDSAISAYLRADKLGQEPKGPLFAAVAACYFSLGDHKTGRKYLQWAIRHNPEHEYVKHVREEARAFMKDDEGVSGCE